MAAAKKTPAAKKPPAKKPAAKAAPKAPAKTAAPKAPTAAAKKAAEQAAAQSTTENRENPVSTPPQAPPPTSPTGKDAEELAAATAAHIASVQPAPKTAPSDLAAGTEGGDNLADLGPSPSSEPAKAHKADLSTRDHLEDCPAERLEAYTANKPNGTTVLVSHCLDCGASRYKSL